MVKLVLKLLTHSRLPPYWYSTHTTRWIQQSYHTTWWSWYQEALYILPRQILNLMLHMKLGFWSNMHDHREYCSLYKQFQSILIVLMKTFHHFHYSFSNLPRVTCTMATSQPPGRLWMVKYKVFSILSPWLAREMCCGPKYFSHLRSFIVSLNIRAISESPTSM